MIESVCVALIPVVVIVMELSNEHRTIGTVFGLLFGAAIGLLEKVTNPLGSWKAT